MTIMIISLIVALTLQLNSTIRSDLHASANLRDGIKLIYIAKSGFNYALAALLEDTSKGKIDSLHETWADPETLSENSGAMFDDGRFQVTISDLSGRIQINSLVDQDGTYNSFQKSRLRLLLSSSEFDLDPEQVDNIIDAIKDWIDEDNEVTRFGAENGYYQSLEKPYSCKNAPVEFLEELLLVRGITKEIFYGTQENSGISNYLSPYGDGKININTADPLVLATFSDQIDQDMAEDMVAYREDKNNDLSNLKWYNEVSGMSHVTIADNLLTTSSAYFEIRSEGFKWTMTKVVSGIVKRSEDKIDILSWKIE